MNNQDDTDAAWDQQEQDEHQLSDVLRDIASMRVDSDEWVVRAEKVRRDITEIRKATEELERQANEFWKDHNKRRNWDE